MDQLDHVNLNLRDCKYNHQNNVVRLIHDLHEMKRIFLDTFLGGLPVGIYSSTSSDNHHVPIVTMLTNYRHVFIYNFHRLLLISFAT